MLVKLNMRFYSMLMRPAEYSTWRDVKCAIKSRLAVSKHM